MIQPSSEESEDMISYKEGCKLILAKMKRERPTLREYVDRAVLGANKSSKGWQQSHPGCDQAIYRNGMWYAYRDIQRMLERDGFKPEDDSTT